MAAPASRKRDAPRGSERAPRGQDTQVAQSEHLSESALAKVFLAPSVTAMALVAFFPIGYAIYISLFAFTNVRQQGFAGLANYGEALTDGRFWESVRNTLVFTVGSVTAEFVIGMAFALVMHQAFFGRGAVRATILVPWVIPTVIASQVWRLMLAVNPGFINSLLGLEDFNWIGQTPWAMVSVITADVWKTAPFVALLLLAGLQTIPQDIYESARVDGASAWQRFHAITLPLLKPAILVALLFRTVDALRAFDQPFVITRGAFDTETLSIIVQQYIIGTPDTGYAAALSTLTFILVLGFGVTFVGMLGRNVAIGGEDET